MLQFYTNNPHLFNTRGHDYDSYNTIKYNDSNIKWMGRSIDSGIGVSSGWNGFGLFFEVKNTDFIQITCSIVDSSNASLNSVCLFYDNGNDGVDFVCASIANQTLNDHVIAFFKIPFSSSFKKIELFCAMAGSGCFDRSQKVEIQKIQIAKGGSFQPNTVGSKVLQFVGDSWGANLNSWARLIDPSKYELYSISESSQPISVLNTNYNFVSNGVTASTDKTANVVIISEGVNSWGGSVTVSSFQTSLSALITKVQTRQPGIKIVLVRVPNNGSLLYGQYGTAMSNVANGTSIYYCDTSSLDSSLSWTADTGHLIGTSKKALANFVASYLTTTVGI